MLPEHNYEKLDERLNYNFRKDRKQRAKELGFSFISECSVKMYRRLKSLNKTCALIGISQTALIYELERIGEPRGKRGGARNNKPK